MSAERRAVIEFLTRLANESSLHQAQCRATGDAEGSGLWSFARGMLDGAIEAISHGEHTKKSSKKSKPMERSADHTREELATKIALMRATSSNFYASAVVIGVHPFLEITGFMNEFVRLCDDAVDDGIDFTTATAHNEKALPMSAHHAEYIAEKFDCIFGPSFRADPKMFKIFAKKLMESDHA